MTEYEYKGHIPYYAPKKKSDDNPVAGCLVILIILFFIGSCNQQSQGIEQAPPVTVEQQDQGIDVTSWNEN